MKAVCVLILMTVFGLSAAHYAFAKPIEVYKAVTVPKAVKSGVGGPAVKKNNAGINGTGIHSFGINGTEIKRRR